MRDTADQADRSVRVLDYFVRRRAQHHALPWWDESLFTIAGTMALVLGVAGIYGVISYAVSQRRREIGIRIALGAPSSAVTGLFVRHGMILAGVGVAIGLATAFGITRLMASLLFEVSPVDPLTYALVSVTLFGATVLACYLPALRATRVDPIGALRAE